MAATATKSNGNLIITFTYTAPEARMLEMANGVARALYDQGAVWWPFPDPPPAFDFLTNRQKLAMLDLYVKRKLIHAWRTAVLQAGIAAAETESDTVTNIEMG